MIKKKYAQFVFIFLMSFGMSLIMSGVVVAVNTSLTDGFFGRWFYSWMFAFPVALLAAIIIAPMIRSLIDKITIVLCMYALSLVMKNIPMGITYASFAGLTIIATVIVGIVRFNQVPNLYSLIGLALIIVGVLMVNLLGNN